MLSDRTLLWLYCCSVRGHWDSRSNIPDGKYRSSWATATYTGLLLECVGVCKASQLSQQQVLRGSIDTAPYCRSAT